MTRKFSLKKLTKAKVKHKSTPLKVLINIPVVKNKIYSYTCLVAVTRLLLFLENNENHQIVISQPNNNSFYFLQFKTTLKCFNFPKL